MRTPIGLSTIKVVYIFFIYEAITFDQCSATSTTTTIATSTAPSTKSNTTTLTTSTITEITATTVSTKANVSTAANVSTTASTNVTNTTTTTNSNTNETPSTTSLANTTTSTAMTTVTTTTTTLSPEEIFHRKCMAYEEWLPKAAVGCSNPFDLCFLDIIDSMNDYLKCKTYMNETQPSRLVQEATPMLLPSYMFRLARNIIKQFIEIKTLNPRLAKMDSARRTIEIQSNFIFATGLRVRYGDFKWPDYTNSLFSSYRPKGTWNKRNDSVTIPYGSLPKGEYQYHNFIYENLADTEITDKEQVRLMDDWPEQHPIYSGSYLDYMAEKKLYFIEGLKINTATIQIVIKPSVNLPLPGEIIIVFNHKNYNMKNPICVYWQYIKPDDPSEFPSAGYWSNYGVHYRNGNQTMTVCKAYHEGIFAVLMEDIVEGEEEYDFWGLILILGMIVAIMISGAYISAMFMFKMHTSVYNRLFMYTDFSVFMYEVSFLYAFMQRKNWEQCTSMTTIMEIWQVQIVTWLLLQNVHQFSRLRSFFNKKTNIDALYLILGWGIPIAVAVALQEFPHGQYDKLRYCWADFVGSQWLFYAGPIIVIMLSTFSLMFLETKEMKKSPEKAEVDINFIRATKAIKSSTIIILTVAASWVAGTFGLKAEGWFQVILMVGQPFICIVLSWEMWNYFFSENDAVVEALAENKKIKEYQRFRKFKHLQGIKMKVKYIANEGDVDMDYEEFTNEENDVIPIKENNDYGDDDLNELIDWDEDDFKM